MRPESDYDGLPLFFRRTKLTGELDVGPAKGWSADLAVALTELCP